MFKTLKFNITFPHQQDQIQECSKSGLHVYGLCKSYTHTVHCTHCNF